MNKKQNIIYLAGLLDGEGHFRVQNAKNGEGRPYLRPEIDVTNTNEEICIWLELNFGGKYRSHKGYKETWSRVHRWTITGRKAIELAKQVEPYLIIKRDQVKRLTRIKRDSHGFIVKATAYN